MKDDRYYKTSFEDKKEESGDGASVFMFVLCVLLFGIVVGNYLRPINMIFKKDNYTIVVNRKLRDVRNSPHYDLIQHAWENDENQLLLKMRGRERREGSQYYDWLHDTWVDK